jgi:4-hydroxy-tetrahydrodipicolinate synthase
MKTVPRLTNALCTMLNPDETLHWEGMEAHQEAQWKHGFSGLLVGGSMGLMQHLRDDTYRELIHCSTNFSLGRGEILVGVGDTSYARTRARMEVAQSFKIDGIVVLTPYFYKYSREDLLYYFKTLADEATKPLFVYYLPSTTGVTMDLAMALELSKHPNIQGIKCSCDYARSHELRAQTPTDFRVIVAQPTLLAPLIRSGFTEHLDGIFAVLPGVTQRLVAEASAAQWTEAEEFQSLLARVLVLLRDRYPIFPACEALLNSQGVAGKCHTSPIRSLSAENKEKLLAEPLIRQVLSY